MMNDLLSFIEDVPFLGCVAECAIPALFFSLVAHKARWVIGYQKSFSKINEPFISFDEETFDPVLLLTSLGGCTGHESSKENDASEEIDRLLENLEL